MKSKFRTFSFHSIPRYLRWDTDSLISYTLIAQLTISNHPSPKTHSTKPPPPDLQVACQPISNAQIFFFFKKFNIRSLIKSHQPLGTVLSQNFNLARTSLKIIPQRWVGTWNIVWLTHRYAFITNKLRQRKRDLSAYVSRLTIKSKDFKLQHHNFVNFHPDIHENLTYLGANIAPNYSTLYGTSMSQLTSITTEKTLKFNFRSIRSFKEELNAARK